MGSFEPTFFCLKGSSLNCIKIIVLTNPYGHPYEELLDRLSECGSNVMITYETGALTFQTDGKTVEIKSFFSQNKS